MLYATGFCVLGLLIVVVSQTMQQGSVLLTVGDAPSDASLKSDDLLHKASEIEQKQKEKVARAAIKLEKEEAKEKAVEAQAAKLRQEAASRAKKSAKSNFQALKHKIILEAAQQLAKAEAEEKAEEHSDANAAAPAAAAAAATPRRARSAQQSDAEIAALERELAKAKVAAAKAERRMVQNLDAVSPADERLPGYEKGDLGPGAVSKWVPEDHPPSHADCKLDDIDCDELWPWGKAPGDFNGPPKRDGPLGDNLVGLFGQDDVVVPTEDSGLFGKAQPYVDKFDHWPEESKKNKDLLYGLGRKVLSQKYTGAGDVYVPLETAKKLTAGEYGESGSSLGPGGGLADMVFGSWHMGFNKPHTHAVDTAVNMFDQPYRQHMSVVDGEGPQVYNLEKPELGKTLGDDEEDEEAK